MAYINYTLAPNQKAKLTFQGKHLVVTQATSEFSVKMPNTPDMVLSKNDYVLLNADNTQGLTAEICNTSAATNIIQLHESNLFVRKRQSSEMADTIIAIEDGEIIGIDPLQNAVQIANEIILSANQSIGIEPTQNSVQIENELIINHREKSFNNLEDATIDATGEAFILGNTDRQELILTASINNTDTIWLSDTLEQGIPLAPGEKFLLPITGTLLLRGVTDDLVHVAEIIL